MSDESKNSPANSKPVETARKESKRIPMSIPVARLSVPDIPGYHLHWFSGESRVQRALQAGYEFVEEDETTVNDRSAAGGENQDMGSRVSVFSGDEVDARNQPVRLYLMKLREELWQEDQANYADRSKGMLEALNVGRHDMSNAPTGSDDSHRYAEAQLIRGEANKNVFKPVKRRG
jgi:hypothetical protein